MNRRLFRVVTALYPRVWRERYAEELSDLCQDYVNGGESTRLRLVSALLIAATVERFHSLRLSHHRRFLGGCAAVMVALGVVTIATNGFGLLELALPTKGAIPAIQLQLGNGEAQVTSHLREPRGIIVLARISAPRGVGAYAVATIPGTARIAISTVPSGSDPALSCQVQGETNVCTEAIEWCPVPQATWQLRVAKQSGPAASVRVEFVVGSQSQAETS